MKFSTDQVRALRAAGVTDSQIVDALAEGEAQRREKNRIYQQDHRARQQNCADSADSQQNCADSADTNGASLFFSREERKKEASKEERKKERGSRLPESWEPDTDDCVYARQHGLNPERVAENFRAYWLSKPGAAARKVNWKLTWQTWVRRDIEFRHRGNGHAHEPGGPR